MSALSTPHPLLSVEDLHTEFRLRRSTVQAVDGVSFSVAEGECVGLVGESGCGKSTTGLSILQLLPAVGHVTRGAIRLAGNDLVQLSENELRAVRGNDAAMIFQDPMTSLNPTWKIGRQIAEAVKLHREVSDDEARARALEVLELVGMPRPHERIDQYPHQLSGGLRQRVMIAMALACDPKLLIADEPTTALDVTIQAQILDLIDDLRTRLSMGVILITHDLGVIAARASRVMVMYAGKIVEVGTTEEIFASSRHPYTRALLNSIPRLDQDRTRPLISIPGLPPDLSAPIVGCRFAARCPFATDQCRENEPPLHNELGGRDGHVFACFHPVRDETTRVHVVDPAPVPSTEEISARPVLVSLEHIVKDYAVTAGAVIQRRIGEVHAVSDVSLHVREGETFGLVGESGCGKTTIGRMIVGLEQPTSGTVRFKGEELHGLKHGARHAARRDLQLMFQDPYASLDPRMRVGTIMREPLAIQHIGARAAQHARVAELMDEVGLPRSALGLYPHEFSGGQRQRIGLARALALAPALIVADEPVSALDVSIQAQILNLMRALQARHNLAYVFISHDLAVVRYVADTIGVMYLGKLVEVGPARAIYEQTAHPYTQALIDAIPVPDPTRRAARIGHIRGELPSAIDPPSGCRFRTRCPFAQEICALEEPALRSFGGTHRAACHFPLQQPATESAGLSAAGSAGRD